MLLQCENDDRGRNEAAARAVLPWLPRETLETLFELNELSLTLLAQEAALEQAAPSSLLRLLHELAHLLGAPARRRAAACPYLLVDIGFADSERWYSAPNAIEDRARARGFFTLAGGAELSRLVLTFAWHLARAESAAAQLLLGMPRPCAALIGRCTLRRIELLGETHPEWLTPRWPHRLAAWRELLVTAAAGESPALERARLRGLTLLAAEVRRPLHGEPTIERAAPPARRACG